MTTNIPLKDKLAVLENKEPSVFKPADLVLSWERSIFSWIIRKMTRSQWSHVGVYADNENVISAVPFKGVSSRPFWTIDNKAVFRVRDLDSLDASLVVSFCQSKIGSKYDYLQGLLLGYRILTDRLDTNDGDPAPGRFVCSELIAEAFASVNILFGKIVDNALPRTLASSPLVIRVA